MQDQEQKEKRRPTFKEIISHIVHSISFRIVLILSIVMGIIFVDIFLRQKQELYDTASEYFSQIGAMTSEILS